MSKSTPAKSAPTQSVETPTPTGSGTVLGSAADTEYAFDNSFTPALVAALAANPKASLDDILQDMASGSLGTGVDNDGGLHHPTIVKYGESTPPVEGETASKTAVLIANQNYVNITSLSTPIAETGQFAGQLSGRGFTTAQSNDKSSSDMGSLWNALVDGAKQGDELVAYYAGHGAPEGLCGINDNIAPAPGDMFSYGAVDSVVSAATSKGANIRFVMDSCHSGAGVQLTRDERINQIAEESDSIVTDVAVVALRGLQDAKAKLVTHSHDRETGINQMDSAINLHNNNLPAVDAPDEAWRVWSQIDAGLRAAKTTLIAAYDARADELWSDMRLVLCGLALATWSAWPPSSIADYRTLGAQINYIDDLSNSMSSHFDTVQSEAS